jgi:hypothetical protein
VGEAVAGADHESLEGVIRVQRHLSRSRLRAGGGERRRCLAGDEFELADP